MTNDIQDSSIELETVEMEHHLTMGEALNRLRKNPDFVTVIEDGYLKNKVLASVSLLAVPQISEKGRRPGVMEDLIAASNLQYYFQMIDQFYEGAKNPILSDDEEEELAKIQAESGVN